MAGFHTKFFPIFAFLLLAMLYNTPVYAGCPRAARCSGRLGLRQDLRRTIIALFDTSRLLARLTSRASNYTKFEFNLTDSCDPNCNSLYLTVMSNMNLTTSSRVNASRSTLLEFYRRAILGYSQELTQSLAELSSVRKGKTSPSYLTSLEGFMKNTVKPLITKAVIRDRKLEGLPAIDTTTSQQHSFTAVRPQSLSAVACHITQCVLADLYTVAYLMLLDLLKIKNNL